MPYEGSAEQDVEKVAASCQPEPRQAHVVCRHESSESLLNFLGVAPVDLCILLLLRALHRTLLMLPRAPPQRLPRTAITRRRVVLKNIHEPAAQAQRARPETLPCARFNDPAGVHKAAAVGEEEVQGVAGEQGVNVERLDDV